MKKIIGFSVLAAMTLCAPASANEPKLEGTFGKWATYSRDAGGDKSCFAQTAAETKSPASVRHGDIYFMVSNWRSGVAFEQPSFLASYDLNINIAPEAKVGSKKAALYVAGNEAFIAEAADEKALVRAMRAGSIMSVKAQSKRGTRVSYSFSLSGITAALKKAKEVCR